MSALDGLPGRVLRVGVTGPRDIDPAQFPRLAAEVTHVLRRLTVEAGRAACAPVRIELLSPLAEGADRLVAECAAADGFVLVCPLPFAPAEYEQDFATAESRAAFRALLARAEGRVLALDGGRGDDEARSYEAVGRLVVRNCDVLIAIWNGRPGQGAGGTADTIRYSAQFGPPVIWLHATDASMPPRWLEAARDLRHGAAPRAVDDGLGIYLDRLLRPPSSSGRGYQHGLLHEVGHRLQAAWSAFARRRPPNAPLEAFLHEQPCSIDRPWRLHGWLMKTLSGRNPAWRPPYPPADPVAARWYDYYRPADRMAAVYAARYRSSYVWIFALAALALAAAAVALAAQDSHAVKACATAAELASLLLILGLVVTDGVAGWHRRATEYRLLAELCRKQQVLAPLAWVVPYAGVWPSIASEAPIDHDAPPTDHGAWVNWLFSAWLRDAPLQNGVLNGPRIEAARDAALKDLIDDQIAYHTNRRTQSRRAGRRLVQAGEVLFVTVLVLVAAKLLLLAAGGHAAGLHAWLLGLGLAGAVLPALSAAFVGIRAYAELELLAEQSDAMLKVMRCARAEIATLDLAAPLASQALGSALAPVAILMLQDLEGWACLSRAKVVEA